MSQEDDFLEMLARLDEEAEAQKKEVITVETPIFDSVKHIAALLERKNKEVAKKNEDYLEGLKQNYLLGPIETSFLIELLMKETEKVNLQIDKKSKDFKNVVLSASKRLGQEIGRISEDIKIPEETIKPIQVKEEPLEYLTLTGQFLPISPEALLVADQLYDSLKNFRTVIKDTKSAEELSKLVLIQSLSELITDKMIKEKLFAQLKGNETKDEVALYSLISVANPAFVDRKFFDVVKNYKQVINLRKKASANIAENLRHVVRNDINYAVMANGINTRIIEELGRIIQPFEKIKDEK
ncbi:hypothetical protein HY837_01190, partial [archaeon]|nr:hypothetical protein [archaeon]